MLAAFLPSYPFRGDAAPYLWWYYRLLTRWQDEPAFFIAGKDYAAPPSKWHGRWECGSDAQIRLGYRLPEQALSPRHHYAWLDESRFDGWLAAANGNPIAVFRRFLTERDPAFEHELKQLLAEAPAPLEAVLTFCNAPSLEAACAALSIPVVHLELGPLRSPLYRETGYLDFRGVNGNTECASRYEAWEGRRPRLDREDMFRFFAHRSSSKSCEPEQPQTQPQRELGVVLQVEDDSNLVAFGNGMDNVGLLAVAKLEAAARQLRLRARPHPGSMFGLREGVDVDDSRDSPTFIRRCAHLLTINSSVGLEAILMGASVRAFGDCSFDFVLGPGDGSQRVDRLNFYLLAYLVPLALLFEPEYLRFRLGGPSEESIIIRHLEEYMKQQGLDPGLFSELPPHTRAATMALFAGADKRIAELERTVADRDREIEGLLGSASWKVTAPLRWLHRLYVKRSTNR